MAYFRQRGDKWSFTEDVGKDPVTNERKQITRSGFKSREEAKEACDLEEAQYKSGNAEFEPNKITIETFFKMLLDTYTKQNLALTT